MLFIHARTAGVERVEGEAAMASDRASWGRYRDEVGDDPGFAPSPLEFYFLFCSGPSTIEFSVLFQMLQ